MRAVRAPDRARRRLPGTAAAVGFLAAAACATPAAALAAQSLSASVPGDTVTVGDPVRIGIRAELPHGGRLVDPVPAAVGDLPEGVRLLGADTLAADGAGGLRGSLRVAFFRTGRHELPPMRLAWARGDGSPPDTLSAAVAPVIVASVLPPGNPTLRDIKDLAALPRGPRLWPWFALAGAAAALAAWLWWRRRRRAAVGVLASHAASVGPRTPYERALERLEAVARARLPEAGRVEEHYEGAADVLRRYLEEAEAVPALERTTSELAWALPPFLSGDGLRDACREILVEADLVKFARQRPQPGRAHAWLAEVRDLLGRWHRARLAEHARLADEERLAAAVLAAGDGPPADADALR